MFGMNSVHFVMVLLLLLFQCSFSMFSLKQHIKHVLSRLSTAMKTTSLIKCKSSYTIILSLSSDNTTTIVESILTHSYSKLLYEDVRRCKVIEGYLFIRARTDQDARLAASDNPPLMINILENVKQVTGSVRIIGTPDLSSIVKSLSKLKTIGGNLEISQNSNSNPMEGAFFPSLVSIGNVLNISLNSCLVSLDGWFPKLSFITVKLEISKNSNLELLVGVFPSLSKIGVWYIHWAELNITKNSKLVSLEGAFPKLSKDDHININENESLLSMEGAFPVVTTSMDNIMIEGNDLVKFDNVFNKIKKGEGRGILIHQHPDIAYQRATKEHINKVLLDLSADSYTEKYWKVIKSEFSKYYTTTTTSSNPTELILLEKMKKDKKVTRFFSHCFENEFCLKDLFNRLDVSPLDTLNRAGLLVEFLSACNEVDSCFNTPYIKALQENDVTNSILNNLYMLRESSRSKGKEFGFLRDESGVLV